MVNQSWIKKVAKRIRKRERGGAALSLRPLTTLRMTMLQASSLHSVEGLLENFDVARATNFFSSGFNPLLFESVFSRAIGFVEYAEDARERELREFVRSELVCHVVPQFVLGCVVPFPFLDQFEAAAFLGIGGIEYVWEKFDAFRQTFDDGEALVIERALDHLNHMRHLSGVCARDKGCPGGDQFFHRIDRHVDRTRRIGLALETDRRRWRGLFLRQAVDEVVHDEIGHVDVLARAVIEMVPANGKPVAVAAEQEHVEIGPGQADAGRERDGAAVNVMRAVAIDEIWKTR